MNKNFFRYFVSSLDKFHWVFLLVFFVSNLFFQLILVLGARKLSLLLLRIYVGLQVWMKRIFKNQIPIKKRKLIISSLLIFFQSLILIAGVFVVSMTIIHLDACILIISRIFVTLFSFWSFIAGLKMLKITVHERSDE